MNKLLGGVIFLAISLAGCGTPNIYNFEGVRYDSKEKFQNAVDTTIAEALSQITPLPKALTKKKLIFAIPSQSAFRTENQRRYVAFNGKQPNSIVIEIYENLAASNYKLIKAFFDAVQRKNIYSSVQLVNMEGTSGSFAPSDDADTLYYTEPSEGSGQWFYASMKYGKQVFAYDRSIPNPVGKQQGFINAVMAQAIRE